MTVAARRLVVGLGLVGILATAACGWGGSTEEAGPLIRRAATAARQLETARFVVSVDGRPAPLANGMELLHAEGVVRAPADVQMQVTVRSGGAIVETEVRVLGPRAYLLNPFRATFEELPGIVAVPLLDPETGIASAISEMVEARVGRSDVENGVRVIRVTGKVPASAVARLVGGRPLDTLVPVEAGVRDSDAMLAKMVLTGPALEGDDPKVRRQIWLSDWNSPVEITQP